LRELLCLPSSRSKKVREHHENSQTFGQYQLSNKRNVV
jgi:hypothetical protein